MNEKYEIVAICRKQQTCLLADYQTELRWDTMLDDEGEVTEDVRQARFFIVEYPDGSWGEHDLDDWVTVTLH